MAELSDGLVIQMNTEVHEGSYAEAIALEALIRDSFDELSATLGCLLRENSNNTVINQQFDTAICLLVQQLKKGDIISAGDHVSGWLRLVSLQHREYFAEPPFNDDTLSILFERWHALLTVKATPSSVRAIDTLITHIKKRLGTQGGNRLRVLFIGDCLVWDIATQIQILANSYDFYIEPTVIAKRVGADLRRSVKAHKPDQFDLIFYSPFSFGFSPEYEQFTKPSRMLTAILNGLMQLNIALKEAFKSSALIHGHFDAPLYIHSVSGIRQNNGGILGWIGHYASLPVRRCVAAYLEGRLSSFIEGLSAHSNFPPLRRIDEAEPLVHLSSYKLGQAIFDAGELHPTALAQALASGPYLRAGIVKAHLQRRKLIVCDLDNTLWDGVIGEGAVRQHAERQKTLLRLKDKGVLLAVSSKNEPFNIRWNESVVSPDDFVMMEINWGRKAKNIRNIANTLNLNPNSFIFLDDRPDERETVKESLPGVLALDPNEPETWKMLEEWAAVLGEAKLQDRTKVYKERANRQSYLINQKSHDDDADEAYHKLNLRLSLRNASSSEIDRVVDLINRTNQFNTTSLRTTKHALTQLEPKCNIMVAAARDKFGDMGIIGVLVVSNPTTPTISHFVLSCRAFGFGFEHAMLQSIVRCYSNQSIRANLVKTPVNGPCQEVFAVNGFISEGDIWISDGTRQGIVPDWLNIEDNFSI